MTLPRSAPRSSEPSPARTSEPKRRAMAASTVLPGACASRASTSASMIVAPQFLKRSTTVDFPDAMLPVRATLSMERKVPATGYRLSGSYPIPDSRYPIATRVQSDPHLVWELDGNDDNGPHTTPAHRP